MFRLLKRISLPNRILIGFLMGIFAGLFFGERTAFLSIVGDVFIGLLQMAVLPYVSFALMSSLGKMNKSSAALLAKKGLLYLIILWAISFIIILIIPSVFPDWRSASYFDDSLVDTQVRVDFMDLFIPSNPFFSYANNMVPAVVLFSMAMGVALMSIPQKEGLLRGLDVVNQALLKITNFVVSLAPIGVFAIAAHASGTLLIEQMNKIEVYLLSFMAFSLITSFYIFPALISLLTPIKYRDVFAKNKGLLITAFATANVFVVISLLITRNKELLTDYGVDEEEADRHMSVLIPTAINFPSAGKLFSLTFLGFAAWFSGNMLTASAIPKFIFLGFFTFFGNTVAALEFLLNYFQIPVDTLQLFMLTDLIVSRFGTLLATVFFIVLSVLVTYGSFNKVKVKLKPLLTYCIVSVGLLLMTSLSLRHMFNRVYDENYVGYSNFVESDLLNKPVTIEEVTVADVLPSHTNNNSLKSIQERGFLRIGYYSNALPYVFKNSDAQLVGFDVDLAHALARDIGVRLEFLRIDRDNTELYLEENRIDLVMSGILPNPIHNISYTNSYLKATLAFIVLDHKREEYGTAKSIKSLGPLKVGCINIPYYANKIRDYLPEAQLQLYDSPREFLKGQTDLDAFVYTAEAGSAWTIVYPAYSVAVPQPDVVSLPLSIAVSKNNAPFIQYLNTWIDLKKNDLSIEYLTNYWIYGRREMKDSRRWNILDDLILKEKSE